MYTNLECHAAYLDASDYSAATATQWSAIEEQQSVAWAALNLTAHLSNYRVRPKAQPKANTCQRALPSLRHRTRYIRDAKAS